VDPTSTHRCASDPLQAAGRDARRLRCWERRPLRACVQSWATPRVVVPSELDRRPFSEIDDRGAGRSSELREADRVEAILSGQGQFGSYEQAFEDGVDLVRSSNS